MTLTIAIPTFDRNETLVSTLGALLPQVTDECRIMIFDNASAVPVASTLRPLLDRHPHARVTVHRNRVNIGANANIMRCFEHCETQWLWVLGDDDKPLPGSIEVLFRSIRSRPKCVFFNYSSRTHERGATFTTHGLGEFIASIDSFSNTLFLSTGIYCVEALGDTLKIGCHYAYSGAPHLACLLMALRSDSECCFSHEWIVDQTPPANAAEQWSFTAYALGMPTLLDLPLDGALREELAHKILATFPKLEAFVLQLIMTGVKEGSGRGALHYYSQICRRLYAFDHSPVGLAKRFLYRFLVAHPRVGYRIAGMAYRSSRKRPISLELLHDRFARL